MDRHAESTVWIDAPPQRVFERLDDQRVLSAHMARGSWMTLGSKFRIELDEGMGRRVGSVMKLGGRIAGIPLSLAERVTLHEPGQRKAWETLGDPQLLVIGAYRMGFEVQALGQGSRLRVWIDYRLPGGWLQRMPGWLLGPLYARWCVRKMTGDARRGT